MNGYGWLVLALVGLLSLWQLDRARMQLDALEQAAAAQQQRVDQLTAINGQQAQLIADRRALDTKLDQISVQTQKAQQLLTGQAAQWRQDFAELKRNDDQVRAYLAAPVPVALGVRYARPATTDPVAWRAGSAAPVPASGLPTAGSSSPGP